MVKTYKHGNIAFHLYIDNLVSLFCKIPFKPPIFKKIIPKQSDQIMLIAHREYHGMPVLFVVVWLRNIGKEQCA